MTAILTILGFVAVFVYGLFQIYSGFIGIEAYAGPWWAWGALLGSLMFRITLPITLGAFYCAWQVWGWHWALATLWALPGLAFMLPAVVAGAVAWVGDLFTRRA